MKDQNNSPEKDARERDDEIFLEQRSIRTSATPMSIPRRTTPSASERQ